MIVDPNCSAGLAQGFPSPKSSAFGSERRVEVLGDLAFLTACSQELDVWLDPDTKALWCFWRPNGPAVLTPGLMRELAALHRSVQGLMATPDRFEEVPLRYFVQGSRVPGLYHLGSDLGFLADRIRAHDRVSLQRYACGWVDGLHRVATGLGGPVISVGLLQGDALGGGFEAALCCNVLIAERSARFGVPDILLGSFPDPGGFSFLCQRLGLEQSRRIMVSGKVYTADEMLAMGVIDQVVEDGCGEDAVRAYVAADRPSHPVRHALMRVRQRVNPIRLPELRQAAESWVDTLLTLAPADLLRMEQVRSAQARRLQAAGGRGLPEREGSVQGVRNGREPAVDPLRRPAPSRPDVPRA